MLCVLCLANFGSGLCSAFPLGSCKFLHACVLFYSVNFVLRASPRKHRVCAVLFPRFLEIFLHACVLFYYSVNYVMRTLPHEHRVCAVLFPRFLKVFLHACVLIYYSVNYVMRALPHKHRVCAVLFPRFLKVFARLCFVLLFSQLCFACFASQTSGLCSAIPSVPKSCLHACVLFYYSVNFVMPTLPRKPRVCAVLFPCFL